MSRNHRTDRSAIFPFPVAVGTRRGNPAPALAVAGSALASARIAPALAATASPETHDDNHE